MEECYTIFVKKCHKRGGNNTLKMKKIIGILLMIILLISTFLVCFERSSNAGYSSKFANYPGYKELIEALQKAHPNWEFEILETGLNWADVVKAESVARHGRSLIQSTNSLWRCSTCKSKEYEPNWYCASTEAVAYYLDPRNSLNENYIFQFEQLTYDTTNQTRAGVEQILSDCKYMQNKMTYYDTKGKKHTLDKTGIDIIMEAAKKYNISPYHLASRIRQEQGTSGTSNIISGTWTGKDEEGNSYKGYYNYFNWGAFGSNIVLNALKSAKSYGWTDPEKSIMGGAQLLAKNYISIGQDTLYLQKFDVVDGGDGYYGHQYMTNVVASKNEGLSVKNGYSEMGMLSGNAKMKFKIPVYKNMPTYNCPEPGKATIVTQDVQTNGEVNIREGKGTNTKTITTLKKGVKLLRIEYAKKKENNYYWDKVVLSDGRKGYAIRDRLNNLSLQSNCNEKDIVLNSTEVRNGPGKTGTAVVSYIAPGQIVTVIEKNKYPNLDGENWYRLRLSDNTYGYVAVGNSKNPNITPYDENSSKYDYVKVVCTDGLNIRKEPTTSKNNIIATVTKGTQLFRAEKNASSAEGYLWDKVVTSSGVIGYCVRQDKGSGEPWIAALNQKYEVDDKNTNIICVPNVKVEDLKSLSSNIVVKKGSTTIANNAKIGTGYTITIDGKTYTAVVKGDTNGDGEVKATDYMRIKNMIMGTSKLSDAEKKAADVNNDGEVKATDYMKIKNYIMGTSTIGIN